MMASGRDPRDLLEEMVEELEFVEERFEAVGKDEFLRRQDLQRVAERSLEILGEAAKGLPSRIHREFDELPWSDMARTRDMLIHAYHRVEPEIVWRTLNEDAIPLRPRLEKVLRTEEKRWEKDDEPGREAGA